MMLVLLHLLLVKRRLTWLPVKESTNIELISLMNKRLLPGNQMQQGKGWKVHQRGSLPNRLKKKGLLIQLGRLGIEHKSVLKMLWLSGWALRLSKLKLNLWKELQLACLQLHQNDWSDLIANTFTDSHIQKENFDTCNCYTQLQAKRWHSGNSWRLILRWRKFAGYAW